VCATRAFLNVSSLFSWTPQVDLRCAREPWSNKTERFNAFALNPSIEEGVEGETCGMQRRDRAVDGLSKRVEIVLVGGGNEHALST